MTAGHTLSFSRHHLPESCKTASAPEGVGNAGRSVHPQPCAEIAHGWPRVTGDSPAFPHADGFNGFLRALLGDEFLFVTVASRIGGVAGPVGSTSPPQGLTPATGARTTRLHRTQLSRPDAPASHVLPA